MRPRFRVRLLGLLSLVSSAVPCMGAPPDTLAIYGAGHDPLEGRFQDVTATRFDAQGWTSVDLTQEPIFWQVSPFNAENLNGHGPGNLAAWCGQSTSQQPGWGSAPGYGNSWTQRLVFRTTLTDPGLAQVVELDFYLNHDTEPFEDYFHVEYDSAGTWIDTTGRIDGRSGDAPGVFPVPGRRYADLAQRDVVYRGNDYGGPDGDEIVLRLTFRSDGAWSDQDGLWPTDAGAGQVDDITVTWSEGAAFEDFESGDFSPGSWMPEQLPLAGDFAGGWTLVSDLDPCRENSSPVFGFVDAGQDVNNADTALLIDGFPTHTSGSLSSRWSYGVEGGWVTNFRGGLTPDPPVIRNEIRSPPIAWDLPGAEDDGADWAGAILRLRVWEHLPLENGLFWSWHLRSSSDGTLTWSQWRNDSFLYWTEGAPRWRSFSADVTEALGPDATHVQVALRVSDLSDRFELPGEDGTPSPFFDDVSLHKMRIAGPRITVLPAFLAHDGFPPAGGLDVSTPSARDALDIPFDAGLDVAIGSGIVPSDSVVADVESLIPGSEVVDVRLHWVLDLNPLFEPALRHPPARPEDRDVQTADPARWTGTTLGSEHFFTADQYSFDLPDEDFLYPGDVLRWYLQASDDAGRVTTLPRNTDGFLSGEGYDRRFVVHGLPSLRGTDGTQPTLLVYDDAGHGSDEPLRMATLTELGLVEGVDFDVYATRGSTTSNFSNGLGSAGGRGATLAQTEGYSVLLYTSGRLDRRLLSDGSGGSIHDDSDDVGLLTAWHELEGPRTALHFGSHLLPGLVDDGGGAAGYAADVLASSARTQELHEELSDSSPRLVPLHPGFESEGAVDGGCPDLRRFATIEAIPPAVRGHAFTDRAGTVLAPGLAASVVHDRVGADGARKLDLVFPFTLSDLRSVTVKTPTAPSVRARLLGEALALGGLTVQTPTPAPTHRSLRLEVAPNPFNPRTVIRLVGVETPVKGSLRVYNPRGELVRTLFEGSNPSAEVAWDGRDDRGAAVASGVFLIRFASERRELSRKVALLR